MLDSESSADGSWLWAWANPSLDLPDDHLATSRRIAELGRERRVPELSEGRLVAQGRLSAHTLGVVGSGLLGSDAHFVAPTGSFTAVLALRGPELALGPLDADALARTLIAGIGRFELEHKPAIAAYLERRCARAEVGDAAWNVLLASGERVGLEFDELQRLVGVQRPDVKIFTGPIHRAGAGGRLTHERARPPAGRLRGNLQTDVPDAAHGPPAPDRRRSPKPKAECCRACAEGRGPVWSAASRAR